jgi:polysaccharide chain length determinant protein (PEP-CTERM system associated)
MADSTGSTLWDRRLDILRRRWVLATAAALGTLVAVEAFVMGLPNMYRASATLLVRGQALEALVPSAVPGEINARLQTIKQEAFSRLRLVDLSHRFDPYGMKAGHVTEQGAVDRFLRDIRVEPTTTDQTASGRAQTIAFTVSYVGTEPRTTAEVTNALASFFVAQNDRIREQQASRTTALLTAQLADARDRLQSYEATLRSYTSRNIGALPRQIDTNLAAITRLDAQLRLNADDQLRLLERRQSLQNDLSELAARRPAADDTSPQARLGRLEADLAEMRTKFAETYPDIKTAKSQIETLKREIAAGESRPAAPNATPSQRAALQQALAETNAEIDRIARENTDLKNRIGGYERRVERAPAYEPEFDGLLRDYTAMRDRYESLERRLEEARLAERAEQGSDAQEFKVLDAALPPPYPTGPARQPLLALGLLLAIGVGLAAAWLADQRDTSFHSLDDLRAFTRVPILASIPEIPVEVSRLERRSRAVATGCLSIVVLGALAGVAFALAGRSEFVSRLLSRVS